MTDIQDYLDRQKKEIRDHLTIKYPNEIFKYAMHISKDKELKEMYPQIGNRQSKSEDRTIPRVCVCDTLIDCINGYQTILNDYIRYHPLASRNTDNENNIQFNGGWYIYHIDYEYGLIPDNDLVGDQDLTNEYWLVNYHNDTPDIYYPRQIGRFFIREYSRKYLDKDGIKNSITMYLEIDEDMLLYKDILLHSGTWRIDYSYIDRENLPANIEDILIKYTSVDSDDYQVIKEKTVSMLEYHDRPYTHW